MKKSLICGVSGQDGAYLASLLLKKGHTVYGTSRDAEASSFLNLKTLGIRDKVQHLYYVPIIVKEQTTAVKGFNLEFELGVPGILN